MNDLYPGIAACLAKILRLAPDTAQPFDPDADLARVYGLTSLDMMLFLTSACQTSGVPLNQLGEDDLVALTSLRKINQLLSEKLQQGVLKMPWNHLAELTLAHRDARLRLVRAPHFARQLVDAPALG